VVRRAAFPLFRPAAADRGQQRNLETYNACRSTDRLQTFRAGAALARHSQPVQQYRRPLDRLFLPLAIGERDGTRLRRPFQNRRAAFGAVHLEHDFLTKATPIDRAQPGARLTRATNLSPIGGCLPHPQPIIYAKCCSAPLREE